MKLDIKKISRKKESVIFFEVHARIERAHLVCIAVEHQGFAAILRKNWCF